MKTYTLKFRPFNSWGNIKTGELKYGIQVLLKNYPWLHCAQNGRPLLFSTAKERNAKLRELRIEATKARFRKERL